MEREREKELSRQSECVQQQVGGEATIDFTLGRAAALGFTSRDFPIPAYPGIPAFLHFPFPGGNGRESREIKYGSFYLISTSNLVFFSQ
jgi:hypothetical protein